jgi:hypothetical protein
MINLLLFFMSSFCLLGVLTYHNVCRRDHFPSMGTHATIVRFDMIVDLGYFMKHFTETLLSTESYVMQEIKFKSKDTRQRLNIGSY